VTTTRRTNGVSGGSEAATQTAMGGILVLLAAFALGPWSTAGAESNSLRELAAFRLSMDKIRRASEVGKALEKLSKADASLKGVAQFDQQQDPRSVDEAVRRVGSHPQAVEAIRNAGLSTREYVLTMYCFVKTTQALFLPENVRPTSYPAGVSKENVVFVKNHLEQINRLFSDKQ